MELEYTVEPTDIAEAWLVYLDSRPFQRRLSAALRWGVAPILLVMGLTALYVAGPQIEPAFLVLVGGPLLFGGRRVRRVFYQCALGAKLRSTPMSVGRKRLVADATGVSEHFDGGHITLSWSSITLVHDSPKVVALFSGAAFVVVPRHRVHKGDPQQFVSEARAYLAEHAA